MFLIWILWFYVIFNDLNLNINLFSLRNFISRLYLFILIKYFYILSFGWRFWWFHCQLRKILRLLYVLIFHLHLWWYWTSMTLRSWIVYVYIHYFIFLLALFNKTFDIWILLWLKQLMMIFPLLTIHIRFTPWRFSSIFYFSKCTKNSKIQNIGWMKCNTYECNLFIFCIFL